jgi:chemotaxis signal transduction protein
VVQVAATDVAAPPSIVKGLAAEYITGLVVRDKRTLIVLNTGRLLTSKEKLGLDTAMETHAAGKEKEKAKAR